MCESIWEGIKFWLGCIRDGFEVGDCLFGISEFLLALAVGYLSYKKRHSQIKRWEDFSVKWAWIILGTSFVVSTIFVAPFLKFKDADHDKTMQERLDYIEENRPYLEAELVIESFNTNEIFYRFNIQNIGKLPAILSKEEQKSPDFYAPQFQEHNKFLSPQGRMEIVADPAEIKEAAPLDLLLEYRADYRGTNLTFKNQFRFRLVRQVGVQNPEVNAPETIELPAHETNAQMTLIENKFSQTSGGVRIWLKGGLMLASSTNRCFFYNSESRIVMFKSVEQNGKQIVLSSEILQKNGHHGWHLIYFGWGPQEATLIVDTNAISYPDISGNKVREVEATVADTHIVNRVLTSLEMEEIMRRGPPTNRSDAKTIENAK